MLTAQQALMLPQHAWAQDDDLGPAEALRLALKRDHNVYAATHLVGSRLVTAIGRHLINAGYLLTLVADDGTREEHERPTLTACLQRMRRRVQELRGGFPTRVVA